MKSLIVLSFSGRDEDNNTTPDNTDEDLVPTEVTHMGYKGKRMSVKRKPAEALYKTRGMKKDHKVP